MKLLVTVLFVAVAAAQDSAVIRGQIQSDSLVDMERLSIQMQGPIPSHNEYRADVDPSGAFHVRDVTPGTYTLQVVDTSGHELMSRAVQINSASDSLSLSIPQQRKESPGGGAVSVSTLRHKPKKEAYKACLRAEKLSEAHDFAGAAAALEKAAAADPQYAPAFGNLGAQYARLERWKEAEPALRKAIELDPATGVYYSNLAYVMINLKQHDEAEKLALRAVELDGVSAKSQLLLGSLLATEPQNRVSAIRHLEYAARELPEAHRVLARLYTITGRRELAEKEMQKYEAAVVGTATAQ